MQFRVYGPHDTARHRLLSVYIVPEVGDGSIGRQQHLCKFLTEKASEYSNCFSIMEDTVEYLKTELCSILKIDPDDVELWDYWELSKYESLEDRLDQELDQANVQNGQPLLLEPKVLRVKVECSLFPDLVKEVQIRTTETVNCLKDLCARKFEMQSGSFVLWDYYGWTKQCRLDDRLQQTVSAVNIIQNQTLLLEERTLKLIVHCPCISAQQKTISICSGDTVSSLKDKACAAFDVEQWSVVLWDYYGNSKQANLQDNMNRFLAEAQIVNKQAVLLEAKVLKLNVYRQALDGTISRPALVKKSASERVSTLKAAICASFSLDPSSAVLWDYLDNVKGACLDDQPDSTLASVRLVDKQSLLIVVKPPPARQQQARQLPARPQQQHERQQIQRQQQQQQQSSPTQEQLLHALLEYVVAPRKARSSCPETEEQIVELLNTALHLHSQACSTTPSRPQSQSVQTSLVTMRANSNTAAEELQQLKSCVVCLDAPRSVMLLPCKHLALCADCSQQLKNQARNDVIGGPLRTPCPVCRVPAHQHLPGVILS